MAGDLLITIESSVGVLRLNRPETLNALSVALMGELARELRQLDRHPQVNCLLLLGGPRAFASSLDVTEIVDASVVDMQARDPYGAWDVFHELRKPVLAGVAGYAVGAGCELALACDIVIAADTARFALPQTGLGIIPAAGGTQRLARCVGQAVALDMILTGRTLSAREALQLGLVSRVVPRENCDEEALALAREIARRPPLAIRAAKAAVQRAFETPLREGLVYERQACYLLFATDDQKEGMRAFLERRPAAFAGR
ncbi:MAG: enoyl-CoA hydratase/isomerase family protein [Phycisphaerales bacterium]|nr:enoyl-CoA hydratase/isomerase family protein [Phycisphaerales bacterium]